MSYPPPYDPFGQQQPPPQFPPPGGYYVPPQYDARYGIRPPPSSGLAIMSMIGGILSLIACWFTCCCFLSPFVFASSLTSILMGHLALSQIHRSLGGVSGREMAWVGLGTSYPAAAVSGFFLAIFIFAMVQPQPAGAPVVTNSIAQAPGEAKLQAVVTKIASDSEGTAHGNTAAASELAEAFNERMQTQRDKLARENPLLGVTIDDGEFITWCELRDGRCAFVVHVPAYRNFSAEGKVEIEKLAWLTAQEVLREKQLPVGTKLAVGTKGLLLWGSVMIGKTVAEGGEKNGIEEESEDAELLYPFFEPIP